MGIMPMMIVMSMGVIDLRIRCKRNASGHGQRAQQQQTRNKLHFRREWVMYYDDKKSLSRLVIYFKWFLMWVQCSIIDEKI